MNKQFYTLEVIPSKGGELILAAGEEGLETFWVTSRKTIKSKGMFFNLQNCNFIRYYPDLKAVLLGQWKGVIFMLSVETESKLSLKYHLSISLPNPRMNFYQLINLYPDPDSKDYFLSYTSNGKESCYNQLGLVVINWTLKKVKPVIFYHSPHRADISCVKNMPNKNIYFLGDLKGYVSQCKLIKGETPYFKKKQDLIRASSVLIYLLEVSKSSQFLIVADEKAQIILINIAQFKIVFKREMNFLSIHPFFLEVTIFADMNTGKSTYYFMRVFVRDNLFII